jgi:glycosyltransferase involved in cell wall biosynthesis
MRLRQKEIAVLANSRSSIKKISDKEIDLVKRSGYFDVSYYGDFGTDGDPEIYIKEYLTNGERAGRLPSRKFDPGFYLSIYDDVLREGISPLLHYIIWGKKENRYPNRLTLQCHAAELISSNVFDGEQYLERYGRTHLLPAEDYLINRNQGRIASNSFDQEFYVNFYNTIYDDKLPPIIDYIRRRKHSVVFGSRLEMEHIKNNIIEEFDLKFYNTQTASIGVEPLPIKEALDHYLREGVNTNLSPRNGFSPRYYRKAYLDIAISGVEPFYHYINHGVVEKRKGDFNLNSNMFAGDVQFDPAKKTILIVNHEASRTGAPLVGLNLAIEMSKNWNVFVFIGRDAGLQEEFRQCSVGLIAGWMTEADSDCLLIKLKRLYSLKIVLMNSVETSVFAKTATRIGIATVSLIHEFAEYTSPQGKAADMVRLSNRVVVPSKLIQQSLQEELNFVCGSTAGNICVRSQGHLSYLPPSNSRSDLTASEIKSFVAQRSNGRNKIVLGAGWTSLRKGVDLFVQAAGLVNKQRKDVAFLWVGDGYHPSTDMQYSVWIDQMVKRMGLSDVVMFLPSQGNLDACFEASDLFFLSSRLDPYPNVVIDALCADLNVVCFNKSTGCAELFEHDTFKGACVPYGDVVSAAETIIGMIDSIARDGFNAFKARKYFDLQSYVTYIETQIDLAVKDSANVETISRNIYNSRLFDPLYYEGGSVVDLMGSIRDYVSSSTKGLAKRNPLVGFSENLAYSNGQGADSDNCALDLAIDSGLADDLSFNHRFSIVGMNKPKSAPTDGMCLHIHFHYSDIAKEFVSRLNASRSRIDIFATTTSRPGTKEVEFEFTKYIGGEVHVIEVPNRGRDIGPLLVCLREKLQAYDIIGHLHAKKSVELGGTTGERWRNFLLDTLLGGADSVISDIRSLFTDEKLGLIFAEDPHNVGWTSNRLYADSLLKKMALDISLPSKPIFPIGAMFWARRKVLEPFWNLNMNIMEFPIEPLPYDGTMLHAIERMFPSICEAVGFEWMTVKSTSVGR